MVQVWNMDGLVDHQVKNFAGLWVVIGNHTADGVVALLAEGGVIPFDINWSVIVENN
jgi:hypothetical protein